MSDIICKYCHARVTPGTEHHCEAMQRAGLAPRTVPKTPDDDSDACFITSAAIAAATDSAIIGTILGGNPVGAIAGETLGSSDDGAADDTGAADETVASDESGDDDDDDDDDDD